MQVTWHDFFSLRNRDDEGKLSPTAASVKTASAMEPSATVKPATKTRVTSGGVRPGYATVVKAAEGTRVRAGLNVLRREPVVRARKSSRV